MVAQTRHRMALDEGFTTLRAFLCIGSVIEGLCAANE